MNVCTKLINYLLNKLEIFKFFAYYEIIIFLVRVSVFTWHSTKKCIIIIFIANLSKQRVLTIWRKFQRECLRQKIFVTDCYEDQSESRRCVSAIFPAGTARSCASSHRRSPLCCSQHVTSFVLFRKMLAIERFIEKLLTSRGQDRGFLMPLYRQRDTRACSIVALLSTRCHRAINFSLSSSYSRLLFPIVALCFYV